MPALGISSIVMSLALIALVLLAALLHASWNALLKSGSDRLRTIVVMSLASGAVAAPTLFILPLPARASWIAIALSGSIHVAYNLFLVAAYRYGDLGQIYPIARGASPLLVTLGALPLAGEHPDTVMLAGTALVSCGIIGLAQGWSDKALRKGLLVALTTGTLIAAYTLTDGLGARLSGSSPAYAAWLFTLDAVPMPIAFWALRGTHAPLLDLSPVTVKAAVGGFVSLVAYGLVIFAATRAPMGSVSALRETSVVFAALIGRIVLGESLTIRRFLSCIAVGTGAVLLGYA